MIKENILNKSNKKKYSFGANKSGCAKQLNLILLFQLNAQKEKRDFFKVSVGGLIFLFLCHGKIFLKAR